MYLFDFSKNNMYTCEVQYSQLFVFAANPGKGVCKNSLCQLT